MAVYSIKAPDGRTIKIRAGDEQTAIRGAQEWASANPKADPGNAPSSETFDSALAEASARSQSLSLPSKEPAGPDIAGATAATLGGMVNSIPVLGPLAQNVSDAMIGAGSAITGGDYNETVQGLQDRRADLAEANPIANVAGSLAAPLGLYSAAAKVPVAANALGMSGSMGKQMLNSGLSALGLGTADNMVRGQAPTEALTNAAGPAALASAVPGATALIKGGAQAVANTVTNAAQRAATSEAIQGAPGAAALKEVARSMFANSKASGLSIKTDYLASRLQTLAQKADDELIDSELDAPVVRAFNIFADRIGKAFEGGKGMSLGELHNLRQIAQDIVIAGKGNRTARFGNQLVDEIDDIVENLDPSHLNLPANQIGSANLGGGQQLLDGIETWGRARRVDLIEEAIAKAANQASGMENGLRTQFRALLQNAKTRNLFTAEELRAIRAVANGTGLSNLTRLIGSFGFDFGSGRNALGGTIGAMVGGIPGVIIGSGARKVSENMATGAAERAAQVVATDAIPTVAPKQVPRLITNMINALGVAGRGAALGLTPTTGSEVSR